MPTRRNLKKVQRELTNTYKKEQEYIQSQIDKIRNSLADRQSRIAWQTVNEMNKRKNTSRANLKVASQEEQKVIWKKYLKNLLGNSSKVTNKPITKIMNRQLDIKLGQFIQEELNEVLGKIKNRKTAGIEGSMEDKEI